MSRNSQRRKDWDEEYDAGVWREKIKPKRKQTKDWFDDEQMFQKRRNHRNKKDSSRI